MFGLEMKGLTGTTRRHLPPKDAVRSARRSVLVAAAGFTLLSLQPLSCRESARGGTATHEEEPVAASASNLSEWLDAIGEVREPAGVRARDALTRQGAHAVPRLLERLTHPEPGTRAAAALVLGNIGDPRALGALGTAVRDPDARVRYRAAYALGRLKDPRAVASLAPLLRDPSRDVVQVTVRSLEECRCKVRQRGPQGGYDILPSGNAQWQTIVPNATKDG